MNEERLKILNMLQEGKISVDGATRLLEAIDRNASSTLSAEEIVGEDAEQSGEDELDGIQLPETKVRLRLSLQNVKLLSQGQSYEPQWPRNYGCPNHR